LAKQISNVVRQRYYWFKNSDCWDNISLNLTLTFKRSYILKKNTNERLIFQVEFHLCFVRKSAIKIV
jgi:hypothetical protein